MGSTARRAERAGILTIGGGLAVGSVPAGGEGAQSGDGGPVRGPAHENMEVSDVRELLAS
jgi:hypothetical protein